MNFIEACKLVFEQNIKICREGWHPNIYARTSGKIDGFEHLIIDNGYPTLNSQDYLANDWKIWKPKLYFDEIKVGTKFKFDKNSLTFIKVDFSGNIQYKRYCLNTLTNIVSRVLTNYEVELVE